jgi:hypothetical protein
MKAYRTPITKGFMEGGLRALEAQTRNSGLFDACSQVRITKAGLEGYVPDVNDILDSSRTFLDSVTLVAITITRSWPFPQIFNTDVGVYIGAKEGLYFITDLNPELRPALVLYDFGTGGVVWPWSCIPIPGYPAFVSGSKFVYYDANTAAYVVVS